MPPISASATSLRYPILASTSATALFLALFAGPATAQQTPESELGEVVVTGTRTTGRTIYNSASPIDVISAEDVQGTGADNLQDALRRLLPSLNLPASLQPDLGSIARGVQLRNLDPAYTLTLINGKRRNTTALVNEDGFAGSVAVDLALIPTSAVERVEVLRDGASAIYGSSAIAGVINVILRNAPQGGSLQAKGGSTYKRDGDNLSFAGNKGFALGDKGYLDLSAQSSNQDTAVRNSPLLPTWLTYPALTSTGAYTTLGPNNSLRAGTTANPKEAARDGRPWHNSGQIDAKTTSWSFNGGYDLSDSITAYGFGTFANRRAWSAQNFRPAYTVWQSNPGLLQIYPDGFTPFEGTREDEHQLVAGIKGRTADWNWDLSTNYGHDIMNVYVKDSANYKLTYPGAQADFFIGQRNYSTWSGNIDVTRGFDVFWAVKPLDVSLGAEYQREHNRLAPGEPNAYFGGVGGGSVSLVGYYPQDAASTQRNSFAGYAGAGTNLTEAWFVDAAVRAEHYSDFGSSGLTGKFATRYEFSPKFAVRATVSNGFHAPSLVTTSYTNTSDRPGGIQFRLARADSPAGNALGADPLRPEKARNFTVGFGGEFVPTVHWAIDAYQIDVDHVLGSSSNVGINWSSGSPVDPSGAALTSQQVDTIESLLAQAGVPPGTSLIVHYFRDIGDIRSRGFDLTLDGGHQLPVGRLRWSLAANFNKSEYTRISPVPEQLQGLPNISTLSLSSQRSAVNRAPRDKQILGLNYGIGPFSVDLRETRIGELRRYWSVGANSGDYNVGNLYTTDLSLGVDFGKQLQLTVAASNLFDRKPPLTPDYARSAASLAQYEYAFDNSGPLGNVGGTYYASLTWRF